MDSTGIGFIIGRYSEIKRKGGSIVICSMNSTIKKVFNISGLKRICSVAYDEVSADKILGVIA
jgi:stage II sporulation protein AA (anti-sigma F factor antagonist)